MGLLTKILNRKPKGVAEAVGKVADAAKEFSPKGKAAQVHKADMLSDSILSKNIRPLTIVWLLALFTYTIIKDSNGAEINEGLTTTLKISIILCIGFYFPGRDIVKTFLKIKK